MATSLPIASTSMAANREESRRQASPLPVKRGEIGYSEDVHGAAMARMDNEIAASRPSAVMGERHPADHLPSPMPANLAGTPAGSAPTSATTPANASTNSLPTMKKPKRLLPTFGGVMLTTLLKLLFQLFVLAGTGVGWAFAVLALRKDGSSADTDPQSGFGGTSTTIYIHVAFSVVSIAELIFLERTIFRVRAERYAYLHPGEMLPRGRGRYLDPSMPMAPWQRPSLPTYAAALAQSGVRTGDVEDALIAQPPPPAYGKTRGSTLLLQGFFTAEHERRARVYDEEAQLQSISDSMVIVDRPSRPVSYRSHLSTDSEREERADIERARAVEQALAAMEGVQQAHLSDRDRP